MWFNLSICVIFFIYLLVVSILLMISGLYLMMNNMVIFFEWELISMNSMSFVMTILMDWMSLLFVSVVFLISSMVILYSKSYMSGEINMNRFIILIILFVISMMFLIFSPNLVSILLGWDGLGLVSYCLVIFYQNVKSYNSGMVTILMNRIGDVMILMGIVWMFNFGGWNYIYLIDLFKVDYLMMIVGVFIVMAAMTKSAQIPFSSWLPAAMAAPTPISALVHSSTLVTAGVYLLIRFSSLLEFTFIFSLLLLISSLTMFMAGISALVEFDLKKIIALSTLSQLGLMMVILSLGLMNLAYFHMLSHAFFKALLFMCAGSVIHMVGDNQDIRYIGNIVNFSPLTSLCMNVSNLALCGFPFMAGFYSKDLILEMFMMMNFNLLIFILLFISTGLTVSYSIRLLYYSFFYDFNMYSYFSINEEWLMLFSMMMLMILSVIGGSLLSWFILLTPLMVYLTFHMKMLVVYVIMSGLLFMLFILNLSVKVRYYKLKFYGLNMFNNYMWNLSSLSLFGLNNYFLIYGFNSLKVLDFGWSEYLLGQGVFMNLKNLGVFNQFIQYNFLKIFLMIFMMYIFMIMVFMVF
uniref:NADH-ubiquinone oxidoreductase chain 5 n=1 Tax=Rhyacophila quadrifida TaxID=2904903 RepID=A0A9E8RUZ3_9NEOP|nr:NADH dehydrogenase subunit 5 [Rhyacophila quadrifida]UZZ44371.1 NADH dehydrogenase subunit 5 [Rhyacophila quadrifida]